MRRALLVLALVLACRPALAQQSKARVVVWPTLTPAGDAPAMSALHRPSPTDKGIFDRAQELDATLRDAVQDLGFALDVTDSGPAPGHTRDEDLLERARATGATALDTGAWVVSPRVESAGGGDYVVRIIAVPPDGRELRVRVETVQGDSVYVRGLVMLRELLSPQTAAAAAVEQEREAAAHGSSEGILTPLRSEGRAVLAVNGALFGAFTAFGLQPSVQPNDPRVLYPLLALGTGIGIGASLLVAEEWNVTTGDAWFLAAGGWWGAASAALLAAGQNVQPDHDRYTWGLGGGLIGIGLATVALTRTTMDEGDATLAHSGAALGLLLGGAAQYLVRGQTNITPRTGAGYGSAAGLIAAGVLATRVTVSPSRVLLVDVGAGGGALLGAAAASPLLFENLQRTTESNTRGALSATIAGSLAGAATAWWLTRDTVPEPRRSWIPGSPSAGIIGSSPARGGSTPVYGVAWGGALQ
jgi:hypothetical protein